MILNGVIDGITADISQDTGTFEACTHGKATHAPHFGIKASLSPNVFDMVLTDVCGKLQVKLLRISLSLVYFLLITPDIVGCMV